MSTTISKIDRNVASSLWTLKSIKSMYQYIDQDKKYLNSYK